MQLSSKMYDHFTMANNIEKLGSEPVFVRDSQYDGYLSAKQKISHQAYQHYLAHSKQINVIADYIGRKTGLYECCLNEIAENIQEDIAIISVNDSTDWLSYCHVSFPSGWKPEEVIGKSFQQIHQNIPGFVYNPNLPKVLMSGRYQRHVWSPIFENKLNQYPGNSRPFTLDKPEFYIKIERQVTVGFPAKNCFLFVMRQYVYDENQVNLDVLCNTLRVMTEVQKKYKNITPEFEGWLNERNLLR